MMAALTSDVKRSRRKFASVLLVPFVTLLLGCGREQDRIEDALERAFSDAWVGCVSVAWDPAPKRPTERSRMGTCGTGRWPPKLPYTLEALTHAGRVRRLDTASEIERDRVYAHQRVYTNRYELVAGFPVLQFESERGKSTAVCWGDPRIRLIDVDQDRLWRLDRVYEVASAAGIDTLRVARLRKQALSVDVWFQIEVVPRPWAARLEAEHLTTLRRNSFRRPSSRSNYLIKEGERTAYVHKITVQHGDDGWHVPSLTPRGQAIEGTSRQRVVWGRERDGP